MIWDNITWFTEVHESKLRFMEEFEREKTSKDNVTPLPKRKFNFFKEWVDFVEKLRVKYGWTNSEEDEKDEE